MDGNDFDALRRRARAAGLSLSELCRRGRVARSTFFRWEHKGAEPLRKHYQALVAVVEAAERGDKSAAAQP